jgi:hypothetical protein
MVKSQTRMPRQRYRDWTLLESAYCKVLEMKLLLDFEIVRVVGGLSLAPEGMDPLSQIIYEVQDGSDENFWDKLQ